MKRVLVACEYSGRVRNAFAARGWDALSADFEPSEDNSPYHYQGDCFDLLNDQKFDLLIAHPPCTYLSVSGMHWTTRGLRDPKLTEDALDFVNRLMAVNVKYMALENPVSVISTRIRKPNQVIHPWMFGHDASKTTCLWTKNLPKLAPTNIVEGTLYCCGIPVSPGAGYYGCANCCGERKARNIYGNQTATGQNKIGPSKDRWKERSRTCEGIAQAMADQWGAFIEKDQL